MGPKPESLATDLRLLCWGDAFPVDPVAIAHHLGVKVIETSLPDDISGALIKEKGEDPKIVVHSGDSTERKRFTIAHELGHYVNRAESREEPGQEYSYVDLRSPDSSTGQQPEEVFANQFAAALLMPESEVRKRYSKNESVISLAYSFGVSVEAIKYRLKNLRLA